MNEGIGVNSFSKIVRALKDISSIDNPPSASSRYSLFPRLAEHIATLFKEGRLFDIIPRLELELKIVRKYNPTVRPALDPYVSTQIGIFSANFNAWEIGSLLNYPECCIRSFTEEVRYGLDEKHLKELKRVRGKVFVATAGFIPCSLSCEKSRKRGLTAFMDKASVRRLRLLEKDLAAALPHFHPEYQGHYYEIRPA